MIPMLFNGWVMNRDLQVVRIEKNQAVKVNQQLAPSTFHAQSTLKVGC